jgi:hypothetical protein
MLVLSTAGAERAERAVGMGKVEGIKWAPPAQAAMAKFLAC